MSKFTPTAAQARKYADCSVEVRDAGIPSYLTESDDGKIMRVMFVIHRIPSQKRFVVYVKSDADEKAQRVAHLIADKLPAGEWARHSTAFWFRKTYKNTGVTYFQLCRGHNVEDPMIDLELQMMLDQELSRWQNETQPNPEPRHETNMAEAPKW